MVGCVANFCSEKAFWISECFCFIQEHQLMPLGPEGLYLVKAPESLTHETIDIKIEFTVVNLKKIEWIFLKQTFPRSLSYEQAQKNKSVVPLI